MYHALWMMMGETIFFFFGKELGTEMGWAGLRSFSFRFLRWDIFWGGGFSMRCGILLYTVPFNYKLLDDACLGLVSLGKGIFDSVCELRIEVVGKMMLSFSWDAQGERHQ